MTTPQDTVTCLKARIAALAPLVASQREAMDRERRLTRPVFQAIADAGLLRLWTPRAFGGWELSPPDARLLQQLGSRAFYAVEES